MDNDPMIKLRSMIANLSLGDQFIGYPMNCPSPSMYVPLSDDKHWFVQNSSLCAMDIQDNIWDKFFSDNFFSDKDFFFLDWILSQTEFCLRLHTAVVFCMQSFNFYT